MKFYNRVLWHTSHYLSHGSRGWRERGNSRNRSKSGSGRKNSRDWRNQEHRDDIYLCGEQQVFFTEDERDDKAIIDSSWMLWKKNWGKLKSLRIKIWKNWMKKKSSSLDLLGPMFPRRQSWFLWRWETNTGQSGWVLWRHRYQCCLVKIWSRS